MTEDGIQRGSYNVCKNKLIQMGFSELEAEMICAKKFFSDNIPIEEEEEEDDEPDRNNRMNLMFVNAFHNEHPDWSLAHVRAATIGYKDDIEATPQQEHIGGRELGGRTSPTTSSSIGHFTQLMKLIKGGKGLKVGGMGLIPFKVHLPMKNLNRLQTKFEKMITLEQQFLTAEELTKRAEYAKLMKKSDAEMTEDKKLIRQAGIIEYGDALNETIRRYKEKFPEASDEQIERFLFGTMSGIIEDSIYVVSEAIFGDANTGLNNIIKAPIILSVEGVQFYDVIQDDGTIKREYHYKPYEELEMAIDGVDKLSMILEHIDGWKDSDTMGCVRGLVADPKIRGIRGMGYWVESKTPEPILSMLHEGKPIKVSIGFRARRGESGMWNGYKYDFTQRDILLDHLAVILKSIPRCDLDKCGVNVEGKISTDSQETTNINKPNYYYDINKIIYESLDEKNEITNITDLKKGDSMSEKQIDSIDHTQSPDFKIFLKKLQMFIDEGKVSAADITSTLIPKLGDNMEQKEFDDAIALKDAKIKDLEDQVPVRISKILTIKKFTDSYTDDELAKATLEQLNILEDAVSRFNPSKKKPEVIPKAGKSEEVKDAGEKQERLDPRKTFDDVKKDFNLYGIE